ncbi:MAG TPA: sodium/proton-translocating pyrophosphatase, partial [Candidatus Limnocylindrales bacterium]
MSMSSWIPWAAAGVCVAALGIVAVYARLALSAERGSDRMRMISDAIRGGAMTFIKREYRYVAVFAALMVVLIAVALRSQNGWMTALCYILGTLFSLGAGFLGLYVSTRVNDRTAQAASNGPGSALKVAFHSGAVMGLAVAGLGLLGLTICYLIFEVGLGLYNAASIILGFSLGASSVALFARVGGGIFTKATDVGSQLVASSGEELPADELQNPSMVAENVGDNVGEVAGMGADLYESFVAAIVAPIAIAASGVIFQKLGSRGLVLPLAIAAAGIIASV